MAYAALSSDIITLREGSSRNVALQFRDMTMASYSYSYSISYGGTASASDLPGVSGSGSGSIWSSSPYTQTVPISLTALRDDVQEGTETAWLTIQLSGNVPFADGSMSKSFLIQILDDNLTLGNDFANVLRGTSAVERLEGKGGNDTYYVTPGDWILELAGGGVDSVFSAGSYRLSANVENLTLTGTATGNAIGNALANVLTGNDAANVLSGGGGADTMRGGGGNDFYFTDGGDVMIEAANGGIDRINSSVSMVLAANFEQLFLTGTANINGIGNALANTLTGNAGANMLNGGSGDDVLNGGAGSDRLFGGAGRDWMTGGADNVRDTFVFGGTGDSRPGALRDVITSFTHGVDLIDLHLLDPRPDVAGDQALVYGGSTPTARGLWVVSQGADSVVRADLNGDRVADFELLVRGAALDAHDFWL